MILLIVWDGLRPDMVTSEHTPYLAQMAQEGVFCSASHAVFPTATRINSASLSTGCYPRQHGLVDNELYVPALDPEKPISCADWEALQRMAELEGERLLSVPTLGELLRDGGRSMVSAGSGSPGTTYLTNPTVTGPIVNWALAWPPEFQETLTARYGGMLDDETSSSERNRFVMRALREVLIPEQHPDVVTLWLTEPDHMQHEYGLGSPEALKILHELDGELQTLITDLRRTLASEELTCMLLSDHGFSTINQTADPDQELVDAGLKESLESPEVVRASDSLYLDARSKERIPEIIAFLASRPWMGGLFLRHDFLKKYSGGMSQEAVFGGHRRSAEIIFCYRWSSEANAHGVPGTVVHPAPMAAIHGSASPFTINNTLIAWGAQIKEGITSSVPCGIVDVTPTVLHLLGLEIPKWIDGRPLYELLEGEKLPDTVEIDQTTRESVYETRSGTRRQTVQYSHVGENTYLDQVTLE
jgi:arylsulfatase A-like enzyme